MTNWHAGRLVAYDVESTGTDPLQDRILQAAVVHAVPGERPRSIQWLIHPGDREIPTEASDVHGWTLDRLEQRLNGREAIRIVNGQDRPLTRDGALFEIAGQLGLAIGQDVPLVIHNAAFDCTMTEVELARNDIDTLTSRPKGITGVVDPFVLAKQFDPYRRVKGGCKGGKFDCRDGNGDGCGSTDSRLSSLCEHYRCPVTVAHNAAADALMALRLARRLAGLWPQIAKWKLATLHAHQITWRREQADGLREYFDRNGIEHDGVDPGWPVSTMLRQTPIRQDLPPAPRPGGGEHLLECPVWSDRAAACMCDDYSPEWTVA